MILVLVLINQNNTGSHSRQGYATDTMHSCFIDIIILLEVMKIICARRAFAKVMNFERSCSWHRVPSLHGADESEGIMDC